MKIGLPSKITVELIGCARCHGEGHERLEFRKLGYPVVAGDLELNYWATCPTTGEPLLWASPQEEEE
jgi:hypothetical protein